MNSFKSCLLMTDWAHVSHEAQLKPDQWERAVSLLDNTFSWTCWASFSPGGGVQPHRAFNWDTSHNLTPSSLKGEKATRSHNWMGGLSSSPVGVSHAFNCHSTQTLSDLVIPLFCESFFFFLNWSQRTIQRRLLLHPHPQRGTVATKSVCVLCWEFCK